MCQLDTKLELMSFRDNMNLLDNLCIRNFILYYYKYRWDTLLEQLSPTHKRNPLSTLCTRFILFYYKNLRDILLESQILQGSNFQMDNFYT